MKNKLQWIVVIFIILVVVGLTIMWMSSVFDRNTDFHSYTKAVCNYETNYCVDMLITCQYGEIKDMRPIADGVYFSNDWEDPRPLEVIDEWC